MLECMLFPVGHHMMFKGNYILFCVLDREMVWWITNQQIASYWNGWCHINYNFKQKLGPRRTIITFENKSWETWWSVKTYRDTVNVFVFEVWKGTRWWWHFSTEWDNRDLLTQHLSALPSPIQTYKPPSTHCEWAAYHSTHSLLFFFPTTLIYSHNRSPVLFLRGECKHTNRCRGH